MQLTFANNVLPFPGGPLSRIPERTTSTSRHRLGYLAGHWTNTENSSTAIITSKELTKHKNETTAIEQLKKVLF